MELMDTHAHLENLENLDESIRKAEGSKVVAVVMMGTDYKSNLWEL